jgi:hypothetical protein
MCTKTRLEKKISMNMSLVTKEFATKIALSAASSCNRKIQNGGHFLETSFRSKYRELPYRYTSF